jgi:hypothetical protein
MDEELELLSNFLSPQIYSPGSDIAVGSKPSQIILGRVGNDTLIGNQPSTANPARPQIDILLADFPLEDPFSRQWSDTFILGDWNQPYYANGNLANLGLNDYGFVADFNPALDKIQLNGAANNYQLLDVGTGTAILRQQQTGLDVAGFLFGTSNLNLESPYFQYRGLTPPPGPVIQQAQQLGTPGYDIPLSASTDPSGNVYIAGGTTGSLAGSNAGLTDALIVKYDNQGNQLFAQQFGTSAYDTIYGIDTDNQGNSYVAGVTEGNLGGPKQADALDTFVAKYDSNGNQQWIRQIGENVIFNAFNLDVDPNTGDIFISGADVKYDAQNTDDAFVIKFDTNGNQQWQTETGTTTSSNTPGGLLAFDESYGVTVGKDGSVYATGWTLGDLGGQNQGVYDNWIAKYDNNTGEQLWVTQYGTPDYEWSWDVQTDSQGNVYTGGWTLGSLGGPNAGSYDAYLSKYDSQGNLQWIKQFGSPGDDEAYSLFIDENDNLFLSGFTDGELGGTNAGSYDAWVARYDTNGNQLWIRQFGTSDRDDAYAIRSDNDGNLFVTGITQGSLGDINAGSFDGWLAKLDAASGDLIDFNGTPQSTPQPASPSPLSALELLANNLDEINIGSPTLRTQQINQTKAAGKNSSNTSQSVNPLLADNLLANDTDIGSPQLNQEQIDYIANYFAQFNSQTLQLSNGNGGITGKGLENLVRYPYGQPASVPEPSAAAGLLVFGAASMVGARKLKGRVKRVSRSQTPSQGVFDTHKIKIKTEVGSFQYVFDKAYGIESRVKTKARTFKQRVLDKGDRIESRVKTKARTFKQRVFDKGDRIESRLRNKATKAKSYASKVKSWCKQALI